MGILASSRCTGKHPVWRNLLLAEGGCQNNASIQRRSSPLI